MFCHTHTLGLFGGSPDRLQQRRTRIGTDIDAVVVCRGRCVRWMVGGWVACVRGCGGCVRLRGDSSRCLIRSRQLDGHVVVGNGACVSEALPREAGVVVCVRHAHETHRISRISRRISPHTHTHAPSLASLSLWNCRCHLVQTVCMRLDPDPVLQRIITRIARQSHRVRSGLFPWRICDGRTCMRCVLK